MELAQRYISNGGKVAYVSDSIVYHIHNENWSQTRLRYEREALALRQIAPELHLSLTEALRFFFVSLLHDSSQAMEQKQFLMQFISIVKFRTAQYAGSYVGSRGSRVLSRKQKMSYFYPSS
jgi:rhamnosyltransferase